MIALPRREGFAARNLTEVVYSGKRVGALICCQPSPLSAFRNSTRSFFSWSFRFSGRTSWWSHGVRSDLVAALVVVLDHFLQRLQAAVVHVRAGVRDLAERRRLERALVLFLLGDREAAEVRHRLVHADADVGVLAVGEVDALVAAVAPGVVREEDVHAALLALGQSRSCRRP